MRKILLILFLFVSFIALSGKLNKAFEALEIYNYFEAKRLFEKSLKKNPVPAAYGLSIIYARNDNPFSNLDSAYSKIYLAYTKFPELKENQKDKYKKFGVDSLTIINQRDLVSKLYFERAVSVNSIYGFQDFIDKNKWSVYLDSATLLRDELAYQKAINSGKSEDFEFFIAAYPESSLKTDAQEMLDKTLYIEKTHKNSFIDYVNFVKEHPNSPYRGEAEDKIYQISTKTGTAESYRTFIVDFPNNRNVKEAWKRLYNAKLEDDYSSESIMEFKNQYPDYPFQKELILEYNMADKVLYPIMSSGSWGYCDWSGYLVIQPVYGTAEWFQEGLAVVERKGKYGYINKLGNLIIEAKFDDALPFHEGHGLVEIDGKWGMVDRNGVFVIEPKYEDLGNLNDGLCYYLEEDLYGYFDDKGFARLKPQYTEAYDFEDGLAVVSNNDYYGIIDEYGTTHVPFKYEDLYYLSEGRFAALLEDFWGIIDNKGKVLLDFEYDYIGKYLNGVSIIELEDQFNYVDKEGKILLSQWVDTYTEYRTFAMFNNGYAKVSSDKGFNLIDTLGTKLFKTDWEDVGYYSDRIAVKKSGKWGYVNPKGQKIIPFEFTYAYSFKGKSAVVQQSPFYGVINKKGEFDIDPLQEELVQLNDTVFVAKSLGKYGLISSKGDTLLPYNYVKIEPIDEKIVKVEENNELYYYNYSTQKFIRKED
ncbi:WG repeat-containing protein [Paracrocinitomix mangrovi]|uniref:WG repeat-containing protein n=1 Tax=Paracrocinitomix mangrovi TaxID=2862509 RepID=UPI001C8EBCB9|nr:WG repeat-containing protein [Paracrocinitomix mangrovi]UKN02160.1 WG repeat-containing protein [Paracrocinitomix mangrovi]